MIVGGKRVALVYCLHGDETLGKKIAKKIKSEFSEIKIIEGNKKAVLAKKRFIDKDLNRIFPGKIDGDYEERLAYDIKERLHGFDYVIDLHTTTTKSDSFLIITKKTEKIKDLIEAFPLKNVVFMTKNIAKGKALIDHVDCGVSIEFTKGMSLNLAYETIKKTIVNLYSENRLNDKTYFMIEGIIEKTRDLNFIGEIENFELVKKGTAIAQSKDTMLISKENFYPVFYGQKSFFEFLCMKSSLIKGDIYGY